MPVVTILRFTPTVHMILAISYIFSATIPFVEINQTKTLIVFVCLFVCGVSGEGGGGGSWVLYMGRSFTYAHFSLMKP